MKVSKIIFPLLILIVVAVGAMVGIEKINKTIKQKKVNTLEIQKGQIAELKTIVQLCSMQIFQEVPVLDTVNNKVIFAVQKQKGSISFDLESLKLDTVNDTIRVVLPREIIDIKEATEKDSWNVIDTKAIGPLAPPVYYTQMTLQTICSV